MIDMSCPLKQ